MSPSPTLFLAIQLPPEARRRLLPAQARLSAAGTELRPLREDGLHLTLQYLGRVGDERLPELERVAAREAEVATPFELQLEGLGVFPSMARPQVVWAGVGRGQGRLEKLALALGSGLGEAGWALQPRPFRGHCTLARVARPPSPVTRTALAAVLALGLGPTPPSFPVVELALVESLPVPGGPHRYPARCVWSLGSG